MSDELEEVMAAASRLLDEQVGPPPEDETPPDDTVLYCANHPKVETMLRCNRCGKPICTRCAVQTPVGYRCRECVNQQRAVFYNGGPLDYVIGGVIALILGILAAVLMSALGWFFALILGAPIGVGVAELVRRAVRRRKSPYLWLAVGGGLVVGALPVLLWSMLGLAALSWYALRPLVALGIYLALAVGSIAARLR